MKQGKKGISPHSPSRSSVLQEPPASCNGFAILHFVAAILVQRSA